jgi:hypothetical protein
MRTVWKMLVGWSLAIAVGAMFSTGCMSGKASKAPKEKPGLTSREAAEIGMEAYTYGYPLVMMDLTRRVMTNVREPEGPHAPMGQLAHVRTFPSPSTQEVRVPNTDALASMVWLDLSQEPWVITLPDLNNRYCLFSFFDGWTSVFAALGKRTTGTGPQRLVLTGPGWKGKLPSGLKRYKAPTDMVWMLGRIYCSGTPEDYAVVHALQDQIKAVPLSSYDKPYMPPPGRLNALVDGTKPVSEQVNGMGVTSYFTHLALLMKANPPAPVDAPLIKRMARLGIVPGQPFAMDRLDPAVIQVLQYVPNAAHSRMLSWLKMDPKPKPWDWVAQNGWKWTLKAGAYGTDYLQRAVMAALGLGANLPQDLFFAASTMDAVGQPYSGNFRYVMHFSPGQAPSANGFWSLNMYNSDYFLVENPLDRYSLSARDHLKYNLDGSLDIYIQHHAPSADMEANWLPAPEGSFILLFRMYWPKEALFKGTWKLPPVKQGD